MWDVTVDAEIVTVTVVMFTWSWEFGAYICDLYM